MGGTAALPQAKGMDGEDPEDEDAAAEVYVGHRKTKRRKHNDAVGGWGPQEGWRAGWLRWRGRRTAGGGRWLPLWRPLASPPHSVLAPQPPSPQGSSRDWIVRKKAQQRQRGYTNIKPDSRYTGRKRKERF